MSVPYNKIILVTMMIVIMMMVMIVIIYYDSSSSAFPAMSLGFAILGEIFCLRDRYGWVLIFRLRGWCMLGVFLLQAFTCLGHGYQDL